MARGKKVDTKGKKGRSAPKGKGSGGRKKSASPSLPSQMTLAESIQRKVLIMDGPPGPLLQRTHLCEEDYRKSPLLASFPREHSLKGNFAVLNLSSPQTVDRTHRRYIRAGADVIRTNTNVCDVALQEGYGTASLVGEMIREGVRIARGAALFSEAELSKAGIARSIFVAGAIGQGLRSLSFEKISSEDYGALEKEVSSSYCLQVRNLTAPLTPGGPPAVDFILLEEFYDPRNAVLALEATLSEAPEVPVMISICPNPQGRSMLTGEDIHAFHSIIEPYSPMGFGLGGPLDPRTMCHLMKELRDDVKEQVFFCCFGVGPNSGAWIYDEKPNIMGVCAQRLAEGGVVNMIGSSDWSNQEHTCAVRTATCDLPPRGYALPPAAHGEEGDTEGEIPLDIHSGEERSAGGTAQPPLSPDSHEGESKAPRPEESPLASLDPGGQQKREWVVNKEYLLAQLRALAAAPSPQSGEQAFTLTSHHLSELQKLLEGGALPYLECAEAIGEILHCLDPIVSSSPLLEDIPEKDSVGIYTPPLEPSPLVGKLCEALLRLCGIPAHYRGTMFRPDIPGEDGILALVSISSKSFFLTEDLCLNLAASETPLFLMGESSSAKHAALRLREFHPGTYYHPHALEAAGYILGFFKDRDTFIQEEKAHTTNIIIDYINHRNGLTTPIPKGGEGKGAQEVTIVGKYSRNIYRPKSFYEEGAFRATEPTLFNLPGWKVLSSFDIAGYFTLTGNTWDGNKLNSSNPLQPLYKKTKTLLQTWNKGMELSLDVFYCVLPATVQRGPLVDMVSLFHPGKDKGDAPALVLPFLSGGEGDSDPGRRCIGDFVPERDGGKRGPLGLYALRVNHGKWPSQQDGMEPFPYGEALTTTLRNMARRELHSLILSTICTKSHSKRIAIFPVGEKAIPDRSLSDVIFPFLSGGGEVPSFLTDISECGVVTVHDCAGEPIDFTPSQEALSMYWELRGRASAAERKDEGKTQEDTSSCPR